MTNINGNSLVSKITFTVEIPYLDNEKWKIVDGWQYYAISDKGRLFSLRHGSLIKPQKGRKETNHSKVRLSNNGVWTAFYIHRLVALNFISNPQNKAYINHIDGNPLNNCVENIEWATPRENTQHSYKMGFQKLPQKRSVKGKGKIRLLPNAVIAILNMYLNDINLDYTEIGRRFNISGSAVRNIVTGKSWSHITHASLIAAGVAVKQSV